MLLALLSTTLPPALAKEARAGEIEPTETQFTLPDKIPRETRPGWPTDSIASGKLFGDLARDGLYYNHAVEQDSTTRDANGTGLFASDV